MEVFPKKVFSVVYKKKFNLDKSTNYHLSITIGDGIIKVACIEHATYECLLLNVYELPLDKTDPTYIKSLEQFYNQEFFLIKKDWFSVTLSVSNQKFTLFPHLLLSKKDLPIYMHAACGLDPNDEVLVFTHALAKMSVVFSENASVLNWFRKRYTNNNFQIIHQSNAIIEGIQMESTSTYKTELFVWIEASYCHIVVYDKKRILYYNIFTYDTSDDFLACISAVVQIMKLERNACTLFVAGLIEKKSLAYYRLKNYIPQTKFKTKIHFLNLNTHFLKQSGHLPILYFDVMSSLLCHPHSKEKKGGFQ
ncbi:DUF3822 family protein [Cardinium endosymbiont of Culicoides punctatus]|uniref:DUF3822 family protein n=1 Tax=Cardinium endosymbiont of Culicoides punctatus TaxID=2304601 RepID=UPI001058F1E5|nr:DUF3822 family protein [Cardinium endosymbiont of Culicoides punctatus]TDG95468.1 hypothetical protein CCPUN_03680 [Cardinium endosymbiont of Culicoides punctatus]